MAIKQIKCPQCGGTIEADTEKQFATCQNCGKTLKKKPKAVEQPVLNSEENANNKPSDFAAAPSYKNDKQRGKLSLSTSLVIIFSVTIFTIGIMCITAVIYKDSKNIKTAEQTSTTTVQEQLVNQIIDQQKEQETYYDIKYKSSRIIKDSGKSYLIVRLIFTNKTDEAKSFDSAVESEAFQGGVQLERGLLIFNDNYDGTLSVKKIQPGKSIEIEEAFELYNTESSVLLNVNPFFTFTDYHYLSIEIKLK